MTAELHGTLHDIGRRREPRAEYEPTDGRAARLTLALFRVLERVPLPEVEGIVAEVVAHTDEEAMKIVADDESQTMEAAVEMAAVLLAPARAPA